MGSVKNVSGAAFDAELSQAGRAIVAFGAEWCQACKAARPVLEKIAGKGYTVLYVDVDESEGVAKRFSIKAAPTFIGFSNGHEVARTCGTSERTLMKLLSP